MKVTLKDGTILEGKEVFKTLYTILFRANSGEWYLLNRKAIANKE